VPAIDGGRFPSREALTAELGTAGFETVEIEPTRIHNIEHARAFLSGRGIDVDAMAPEVEGKFMSAFIRAVKPAACCGPDCCAS